MQIHDSFVLIFAKLVLALVMFATGLLCLIIFRRSGEWQNKLIALEAECDIARDSVMLQATVARSQLSELRERLTTKPEKSDFEVIGNLINQAMPVLNLFMAKETSVLKWGFAGVKLLRSTFEYFSRQEKN